MHAFVQCDLNKFKTTALWDTGSEVCIVSRQIAEEAVFNGARYQPSNIKIHGLGHGALVSTQQLVANLQFKDGKSRTLLASVVDELSYGLLLGFDFMNQERLGLIPTERFHFNIVDAARQDQRVVFSSNNGYASKSDVFANFNNCNHEFKCTKGMGIKGYRKWAERWNALDVKEREFFSLIAQIKPKVDIPLTDLKARLEKAGFDQRHANAALNEVPTPPPLPKERLTAPECDFPEHQQELDDLINEYNDIFSTSTSDVGKYKGEKVKINLMDPSTVVNIRNYRTPMKLRPVMEQLVQDLLDAGVIEKCHKSDFNSPLLIIPKKSEAGKVCHRIVIDYRALNKVIQNIQYPMPRIQDILTKFHGSTVFSCVDIRHAFYTMEIDDDSRKLTAFSCEMGKFQFKFLPQGLKISPSVFQAQIVKDLKGLARIHAYIDDIASNDKHPSIQLQQLRKLFQRIRDKDYKLKLSKCEFLKKKIQYLGFTITADGVMLADHHLASAKTLEIPKTMSDLKSLLGFTSFLRAHIPNYCDLIAPLQDITKSGKTKRADITPLWTPRHTESFQRLKDSLLENRVLMYPDPQKEFILYTDASHRAMSGVLMQEDEQCQLKPIAYWSKLFKGTQVNWAALVKEARGVYESVKHFAVFLLANKTILRCDHKPLARFLETRTKNEMVNRWSLDLQEFSIEFRWVDTENNLADCLSRISTGIYEPLLHDADLADFPAWPSLRGTLDAEAQTTPMQTYHCASATEEPIPVFTKKNKPIASDEETARLMGITDKLQIKDFTRLTIDQVKYLQSRDNYCKRIIKRMDSFKQENGTFSMVNGLLYKLVMCHTETSERLSSLALVVPSALQLSVVYNMHKELQHAGRDRLMDALRLKVYWKKMYTHVDQLVKGCKLCEFAKLKQNQHKYITVTPPPRPGYRIAIDLWSFGTHGTALTAIDLLSQYPFAVEVPNKTAKAATSALQDVLAFFRSPKEIISDNGKEFNNEMMKQMCKERGINLRFIAPHSPRSNGILERFHKYLNTCVRATLNLSPESEFWPAVRSALEAYRKTPHTASGETPLYLFTAQEPSYSIDTLLPLASREIWQDNNGNRLDLMQLRTAYALARKNLVLSRLRQNRRCDEKLLDKRPLQVGDRVYREHITHKKSALRWLPGYRVVEMFTDRTALIEHTDSLQTAVVNVRNLRLADPVAELIQNTDIDCFPGKSRLFFRADDLEDLDWDGFVNLPALEQEVKDKAEEIVRDRAHEFAAQEPPKKKQRTESDTDEAPRTRPRSKRTAPKKFDDYIVNFAGRNCLTEKTEHGFVHWHC